MSIFHHLRRCVWAQIWLRDSTVEEFNRKLKGSMEPQGFRMSAEAAESFYGHIGVGYPKTAYSTIPSTGPRSNILVFKKTRIASSYIFKLYR